MRPASAAFTEAINTSHTSVVRAEVLIPNSPTLPVSVEQGSVTLDAAAAVRGRLDITLIDTGGWVPRAAADPLAPYGNEIRAYRGIRYPDGTEELVSLGVFRIDKVDTSGDGRIVIAGQDRASIVIRARFEAPYEVARGTNIATAIRETVRETYNFDTSRFAETTATTPTLIAEEGDDRWEFAQKIALGAGMRLYLDGDGLLVLTPEATAANATVQLVEGENGVLISAAREWDTEGTYNRVIATGENVEDTPPARGVATDENPYSPTYYWGKFGKTPRFYASPVLHTNAQAQSAARAILNRALGTEQSVSFGTIVNPALEPGDVARITRATVGVDEDHIIDQITIPLGPEATSSGRTRAVQFTSATAPAPSPPPTGGTTS